MNEVKTKSIESLEHKMQEVESGSIRHQILENAKNFKTSWIGLGQALYSVWKDKLYKEWGYAKFEAYTAKEIGIRKQTALKLLRSYYFLEKEDPLYLKKDYNQEAEASTIPTYESVNVLRLANNKKGIEKSDYYQIKKNVLENGKDAGEVKKDLTALIKQREELLPEEAWQKKKAVLVKRLISTLRTIRTEIKAAKMLPAGLISDTDKLLDKLESQL